jgi:hypothetical protein
MIKFTISYQYNILGQLVIYYGIKTCSLKLELCLGFTSHIIFFLISSPYIYVLYILRHKYWEHALEQ